MSGARSKSEQDRCCFAQIVTNGRRNVRYRDGQPLAVAVTEGLKERGAALVRTYAHAGECARPRGAPQKADPVRGAGLRLVQPPACQQLLALQRSGTAFLCGHTWMPIISCADAAFCGVKPGRKHRPPASSDAVQTLQHTEGMVPYMLSLVDFSAPDALHLDGGTCMPSSRIG